MKFKSVKRIKEYWRNVMDSKNEKLSRGAANINKIISWAKGDNWRRRQKVRKDKHNPDWKQK